MIEFDTCLWYRCGITPVPVCLVLVRALEDSIKTAAFFCSDPNAESLFIQNLFVSRWIIEVTFEELRVQLGFETQRQRSDRAIERTTLCLFGISAWMSSWQKCFTQKKMV